MQPVDDVNLGERLVGSRSQFLEHLIQRHRVGVRIAGLETRERAEEATRDADVRRLEPQIEVVERSAAMSLLALAIRQPADGVHIVTFEQTHAVLERQTLRGIDFVGDVCEPDRVKA